MTTNLVYQKPLKRGILNWRCAVKSCKEPIKTDSECIEINEVNASKAMNLTKERLNASKNHIILKKKAMESIMARPSKVIRSELQPCAEESSANGRLTNAQCTFINVTTFNYLNYSKLNFNKV